MPNTYFKFKQFTVHHDCCAMKVGTDGVLLGAWCDLRGVQTALDVGSGTGLIALMMAQRSPNLRIDAIDIDADAFSQAKINVSNSPFSNRVACFHRSLQDYSSIANSGYDLVVSNPPFFVQSLKSPNRQRSLARHSDSLGIDELIATSSKLLNEEGSIALIYPFEMKEMIVKLGEANGLVASRITNVLPTPMSAPKRVLVELAKKNGALVEDCLVVEMARHRYSDDFKELARDFYLQF